MLLVLYVSLVVALPVALGILVACNGLPRSRHCPVCAGETLRLRSRRHAVLSRALPQGELHARWCPACEWAGTVRLVAACPVPIVPASTAAAAQPERTPGLEIRRIEMDDGPWRVQLECWAEGEAWHGRLLFVGPGGRAWSDGRALLTGRSAVDVFSQVMSLSDRALVGRIRKATR
jgi:hypothetical protein